MASARIAVLQSRLDELYDNLRLENAKASVDNTEHSTAQHSTAQHSTAQHSTAHYSIAWHLALLQQCSGHI